MWAMLLCMAIQTVCISAWPMMKEEVESGRTQWGKEICAKLYDTVADQVNVEFPCVYGTCFPLIACQR